MGPVVKSFAGTVLAMAALAVSFSASALGLGQIEVISKVGEPLVAEIPIVSNDPSELEQLQAGLASPETFARIGLRPPIGIVADLQFSQALDARGNPVIRVTSTQPVNEPLLTFLVEVDWGQGRLVREYSALIDAPRAVSAPLQPEIAAPVVDAPALIERPAVADTSEAGTSEADASEADDSEAQDAEAIADTPADPQPDASTPAVAPNEPSPKQAQAIAPRPVATSSASAAAYVPGPAAGGDYTVRRGDTLSEIAARVGGATLDQTMIALLRANPDAFIGGNINLLKAGVVLRVPEADALTELDAQQARAIVHSQTQEWRASRRAAPQPADGAVNASTAAAVGGGRRSSPSATAGARLEIVPPGASDTTKAGTQSGISAGGEGTMLQHELTQTKETLAAREAETQELKSRVAELEKLQQQQQQLLAMKDSELAAAQQRLAQTQKQQSAASMLPWAVGIAGVLVLAGLFAWFLRRRDGAAPRFRVMAPAAPSSLADAFAPPRHEPDAGDVPEVAAVASVSNPGPAPTRTAPAWHTASAGAGHPDADVDDGRGAHERLELARAYLDLGDLASARQLLGEIVINGDHVARQQAARMLRELE